MRNRNPVRSVNSTVSGVLAASGAVIALLAAAIVGAQTPPKAALAPFKVEAVKSPAGEFAEGPQLTVEGDRVILSWMESLTGAGVVKFSERTATGWTASQLVASSPALMVNPADVPMVRALPNNDLVAAWLQENGSEEMYDLRLTWSKDGGTTWSRPTSAHKDGTKTQHGFPAMFPLAAGGVGMVWLDGRETVSSSGAMTLRAAQFAPDGTMRSDIVVDKRVCDCCPTSAAITAEGPIVAFRDRSADEIRDIAVTRFADGQWSAPALVHRDGWKITGCPVNGPAISARGADVAVAWFTVQQGKGRALAAFSNDNGRTFGAPIVVDDGAAVGRVQINVLKDRSAAVSWIESKDPGSQLHVRRITRDGGRSPAVFVAEGLGSTHPKMAYARDELLLAWVEFTQGSTLVKAARASTAR
jgi:hypothetical protein